MAIISNSAQTLCIINHLEYMMCGDSAILNDFDCPLLSLTKTLYFTSPNSLMRSVSIVHECSTSCTFQKSCSNGTTIERELVSNGSSLVYEHDWSNEIVCLNVYCMP